MGKMERRNKIGSDDCVAGDTKARQGERYQHFLAISNQLWPLRYLMTESCIHRCGGQTCGDAERRAIIGLLILADLQGPIRGATLFLLQPLGPLMTEVRLTTSPRCISGFSVVTLRMQSSQRSTVYLKSSARFSRILDCVPVIPDKRIFFSRINDVHYQYIMLGVVSDG